MKKHLISVLSVLLAVVMLAGSIPVVVFANDDGRLHLTEVEPTFDPRLPELFVTDEEPTEPEYGPDDTVRVSIVLEKAPTIDKGYSIKTIGRSKSAAEYRRGLLNEQKTVTERIESAVLNGEKLSVAANLTLVANLISADVKFGQIEDIEKVPGVKEVVIEQIYEPFEAVEGSDGDDVADLAEALTEFTGAGSRIAIIDSGVNNDHQSFSDKALDYALRQSAPDLDSDGDISDEELNAYKAELSFMMRDDIKKAIATGELNVKQEHQTVDMLYINDKIPFAYNYADHSLEVKNGSAGIHGSHVAGIAAANTYIEKDGSFVNAAENGAMIGRAPDAQILNLKVFGKNLCTDSVIAAAIEDALVLGADVLNLSLGTAEVGFSCSDAIFGDILGKLTDQGVIVIGAVGNDGPWIYEGNRHGRPTKLYAEDVNMSTDTPPSSYADFMGVAWADGGAAGSTINEYSSYGIPSSLMLSPEITADGTHVNSVDGDTNNGYTQLSGTSMAAPDVAGAVAVVAQYLRTVQAQFGNDSFVNRALAQNKSLNRGMLASGLLMSTAIPMKDADGNYYSLLRQGAGLLNVADAVSAKSFIEIEGQPRGRVKAEVGDSPDDNTFTYTFTLRNVSVTARNYIFDTDLFTEDTVTEEGTVYLADKTRALTGNVTYIIDGKEVKFDSVISADVNGDGTTDAEDAEALLDYLSGESTVEIDLDAADVDGDGAPTTYDAHLILESLKTSAVKVDAGKSVTVEVTIEVTEDFKETYPNGTYLEGFTSVAPVSMGEEEVDVTHTIPILGFCGNWSDPSMFDRNSYIESSNDLNDTRPYTVDPADTYNINYLLYQDKSGKTLKQTVNPFASSKNVPLDKMAINIDSIIYSMYVTLIRPAGAICFAIMKTDDAGNRTVLRLEAMSLHEPCAYPSPNSVTGWNFSGRTLSVHASLKKMIGDGELQNGDTVEIGAVAVPEYYEKTPGTALDKKQMKELIESGVLGHGAFMTTKVTFDSEAPIITDGKKEYGDKITINAKDDQNVAYIGLYNANGTYAYGNYSPDGNAAGETAACTFSVKSLKSGALYNLVVGDYAGNTRMYQFRWGGGDTVDISDQVVAYTRSYKSGGAEINRGDWITIQPDRLSYDTWYGTASGMFPFEYTDPAYILAGADAADGYMWQAFEDGMLYAAPINDLNSRYPVCGLSAAGMKTVRDLAFSENDKKLYATDETDTLWQIDPMNGDVRAVQKVRVDGESVMLYGLAVNGSTVYSTTYNESAKQNYLLAWALPSASENGDTVSEVTANSCELNSIKGRYISLTWKNKDEGSLYAASAENLDSPGNENYMYNITGVNSECKSCNVAETNSGIKGRASLLYSAVRGLVNLAAEPTDLFDISKDAELTGLNICGAPAEMMQGEKFSLSAAPVPWNAAFDPKNVMWSSDGDSVAAVDSLGNLKAVGKGEAKITASYNDGNGKTLTAGIDVVVTPAPSVDVAALFREGDGYYYWESFNTATPDVRKRLSGPQRSYTAGTLNREGNCLYLIGGSWGYRVDPETFNVEPIESSIRWDSFHADAAPGRTHGAHTNFGYLTIIDDEVRLTGGDIWGGSGFNSVTRYLSIAKANISGNMGGICFKEFVDEYEYEEGKKTPDGADIYYIMSEGGDLYEIYLYEKPYTWKGEEYFTAGSTTVHLGHVDGVSLPNVSKMQSDYTSSMIYDKDSGYIVLISKIGLGAAKVQVIDPDKHELVMTREFEDDVRQISVLYQYDYSDHPDLAKQSASAAETVSAHAPGSVTSGNAAVDEEAKTVTFELTLTGTTNGLTSLTYDPDVLTFSGFSASMPYHSFSNDGADGLIRFAFADADEIENAAVKVTFTYKPEETARTTDLKLVEEEKGDPKNDPDLRSWTETVTLPAKALESIEITKEPTKKTYLEGDTLDTAGLEVTAHFGDGTSRVLGSDEYKVTGYQSTPGKHTVTVTYKDKTAEFEIEVRAKSLVSVSVSKNPDKTVYVEGTEFDGTGMELTLRYDNGTTETVTSGWVVEYSFDKVGKSTVTIKYNGLETTLEVEVVAKSLVSVSVSKDPDKTVYVEGTEFDGTGMELTLRYDNGTTETVTSGWVVEYSFDKVGKSTVTIKYNGLETTLEVEVVAKSLVSVSVSKDPDKTVYVEGTEFDGTGMELTLSYDNGTVETVTSGWTVEYSFDKVGKSTVTIKYGGKTATLTVTVVKKSLTGIKITAEPEKLTYTEGAKELDLSGGKLMLYYNNGTSEEIELSADMVTGGFDGTKPGRQTVTVSYGGFTDTFEVTVTAKGIDRIGITRKPDKTEYVEGTKFDSAGMEVTVYYNNGDTEVLTEGWEIAYDFSKVGESGVTVSYLGHDAVLTVTVIAKTLTKIEITKLPGSTEYTENDDFDDTGMELTLYYDNGTTETVTAGWTLEYDFSRAGQREVKVRFGGAETVLSVTVKAAQPSDPGADPGSGDVPQTGDSGLYIWAALLLTSGAALALLAADKKRRHLN